MKKQELDQLKEQELLSKIRKHFENRISVSLLASRIGIGKYSLEKSVKKLKEKGLLSYSYSWEMKITYVKPEVQDGK